MTHALTEFQTIIGVQFKNERLLQQALTHRSYLNERNDPTIPDNERMEFLGDAVLDFVVADMLYERYPTMAEGELTRLRSGLVRTEALAELAKICQVGDFLQIGRGEETSGGRERTNNLCRAFEAIIGAIYLDQGLEAVRTFILPRLQIVEKRAMDEALLKDARSQLQEWSQATLSITPAYRTLSESGPDHSKEFVVEVLIGDKAIAQGSGRSKQAAAQSAALAALQRVKADGFSFETL